MLIGESVGRDIMTRRSIVLRSRGFADTHTVQGKGPIYRLRTLLPVPLVLMVALWSEPTLASLWRGGIFLLLGELVRLLSAGYLSGLRLCLHEGRLVTWGPYGLVRHPRGWGTLLAGVGIAVMSGWWPAYLLLACFVAIGVGHIIPTEEALFAEEFGEAYKVYCQRVPRYVPGGEHLLRWFRESRGEAREGVPRFRARQAWQAEGPILIFLAGVVGAMVVQWLF